MKNLMETYKKIDDLRQRHLLHQAKVVNTIKSIDEKTFLNSFQKIQQKQEYHAQQYVDTIKKERESLKLYFEFSDKNLALMSSIPSFQSAEKINATLIKRPRLRQLLNIIEVHATFAGNGFTLITDENLRKYTGLSANGLYKCLNTLKELNLITVMSSQRSPRTFCRAMRVFRANRVYVEHFKAGYKSRNKFRTGLLVVDPQWHVNSLKFDDRWLLDFIPEPPTELAWVYQTKFRIDETMFQEITESFFAFLKKRNLKWDVTEPYNQYRIDLPSLYDCFRGNDYVWSIPDQYLLRYYLRFHVASGLPQPTRFIKYPWYIERELSLSQESANRLLKSKHCQSILFGEKEYSEDEDEASIISRA